MEEKTRQRKGTTRSQKSDLPSTDTAKLFKANTHDADWSSKMIVQKKKRRENKIREK